MRFDVDINVAGIVVSDSLEWLAHRVDPKKRIYSSFNDCLIPFYECMFTRIGLWSPFYDFEVVVLKYLKISSSQFYLGSWAFMKVFQLFAEKNPRNLSSDYSLICPT